MKRLLTAVFLLKIVAIAAQQNWAAIPCSRIRNMDAINKMLVDSLHNELLMYSIYGSTICNTTYKGMFAFNGAGFRDLDRGVNTHNPNAAANGAVLWDCITFGNRTLFGGSFLSVGTNPLYSKSIALWNGAVWDTFPTRCFDNTPTTSSGGGFFGFLKYNNKLWMYGKIDTIGNTITKNLVAYDGNTFIPCPALPVSNNSPITKAVIYKNKLIATGNFYDFPSYNYENIAQFDGTSWSQVGTGIKGSLSACHDMLVYKDTLYLAGAFPKSAGNAGNYIMKWDGTQLTDAGFGSFCGYGAIWKLLSFKNRLYAFGQFQCAAGQKAFGVAYYENGTWTVPQDSIGNYGTVTAAVYNDAIYIGGGFKSINGDTTIQKMAKLLCPDFDAANGCLSGIRENGGSFGLKVFPNPTFSKFKLEYEDTAVDNLTLYNALGQQVFMLARPVREEEIDISHLQAGVYVVKIKNDKGEGVVKLVKQ